MKFKDLQEVQHEINSSVKYQEDTQTYNRAEYWEVAESIGDCEDYALRKLHELLNRGWPIEKLRLATAWCENNLGYHAVLIATDVLNESSGYVGNYVLDNRTTDVYQPETGYYNADGAEVIYKWDRIQSIGGSQTWVKM